MCEIVCGTMCKGDSRSCTMATNLNIDEELLKEAQRVGHLKTKRETVNQALEEFIQRRKQKDILSVFGKVDLKSDYDYKKARTAR